MKFIEDYKIEIILSFVLLIFSIILPINIYLKVLILLLIPFIFIFRYFKDYLEESQLEDNFTFFLTDFSQYLRVGQPLPAALKSVSNNDYGKKLNRLIKFMIALIENGYTFEEALIRASRKIKSVNVNSILKILIDGMKGGGNLTELLDRLAESSSELNYIRKERIARIKFLSLTYYGLFFLYLFILVIIFHLILNLMKINISGEVVTTFKNLVFLSSVINAVFTGFVISKIATGRISAGVIHSIILISISFIFFILIF